MKNKKDRRSFIRKIGLGTAATLVTPLLGAASAVPLPGSAGGPQTAPEKEEERLFVTLSNGIRLELLIRENDFRGIGQVVAGDTMLRDGAFPLSCDIRSPEGISITRYTIVERNISPDRVFLKMKVETHASGTMEYMLHTVRNREELYGWVCPPHKDEQTLVEVEVLPVTRLIADSTWQGFSYSYRFQSGSFRIYKILDRGTWEITGKAMGNECWMRVGHIPSIVLLDKVEDRYSTENYYAGIANPNVFQFLPLQTELQGFTFTAHTEGLLVTWPSKVSHVRTLLEKPHQQDHVFHYHQHCGDLSGDFQTSPVEVLWLPQKGPDHIDRHNNYESVRSFIHKRLHEQAGIREEAISTYGQIEEWDEPDFDYYTDHILPRLIEQGVRRIFIPNEFQNVMNTWGLSNMCCNVDFKFSATVGVDKIERFCRTAKDAGIIVEMWGNTALSTLTEMFQYRDGRKKGIDFLPTKDSIAEVLQRAKEPFVRNPSNAIEADHYTPRFAALNLRDPDILDYWMKCWKKAYDTGIGAIFLDSSFNMTSDKFHFIQNGEKDKIPASKDKTYYRPSHQPPSEILTQYPAHLAMIRQMQEAGYSYCGEDLGVFGIHRHGPDMDRILDSLPLWRDCVINFEVRKLGPGLDPLALFFKGLAYRIGWSIRWDFSTGKADTGIDDPRATAYVKAFNAVNGLMKDRNILPGEKAIQYMAADGHTRVVWTLSPDTWTFEGKKKIWDVLNDKKYTADKLKVPALRIYVLS